MMSLSVSYSVSCASEGLPGGAELYIHLEKRLIEAKTL